MSNPIIRAFSSIGIVCALSVLGCATPPPPLDLSKIPAVTKSILSEAAYYNQLFSECAKLGGNAEIESISKQQDWLAVNWPLIAAADAQFTKSLSAEAINYEGHLLSPQALRMVFDARARANKELNLNQRTPLNQIKTCEFRLSKITTETTPLNKLPDVASYEAYLLAENAAANNANSNSISSVPTLAGNIQTNLAQGKSYYRITSEMEASCPNAFTLVMANDWPKEVYANFCGDELKQVLSCEWGNCVVSQL